MNWFKKNWRKVAGVGCAVGTAALAFTPAAPLAAATGALCAALFTAEYKEGQRLVEMANPAIRAMRDAAAAAKKAGAKEKP